MIPTDEQIDRWYIEANNERRSVQVETDGIQYTTLADPKDRPARRAMVEALISLYLMEGGLDEDEQKWVKTRDAKPTEKDADEEGFLTTFGIRGLIFTSHRNVSEEPKTYTHWMKAPTPPAK